VLLAIAAIDLMVIAGRNFENVRCQSLTQGITNMSIIEFRGHMLKRMKGNLLDLAEAGHFNIIVQGCNCFNTMGSGIAREIRERYPAAYEADCKTTPADYTKLGNYTVMLGKGFNIINAYTQYNFNKGRDTNDVFEYLAFDLILQKLAHQYPDCNFGFPYIGMGLAGGDPDTIIASLTNFAEIIHTTGGSATLVEFVKPGG
jgi:O-acetyl-ADP-ribose deacetylase (regulator of RNase III)